MNEIEEQILMNQQTIMGFLNSIRFTNSDSWLLNERMKETIKILSPEVKPTLSEKTKDALNVEEEMTMADCMPSNCPHCGLSMNEHDGSGFCPGGTEEFGGRR